MDFQHLEELRRIRSRLGWILFTLWLPVILTVGGYTLFILGVASLS